MVWKILNGRYETANMQGAGLSEKLILFYSNTSLGLNSIKHSQALYAGATLFGTGFHVLMAYDFNNNNK